MSIKNSDISRAISHALRHEPWIYELELDENGWVEITELLEALRNLGPEWASLEISDIEQMIANSDKKRHELKDGKIRAIYGHSLPGAIKLNEAKPPDFLYHGTSPGIVGLIQEKGLLPMNRQYVHISVDIETAMAVGKRKNSSPVILVINSLAAHNADVTFFKGNDKVWLAHNVPSKYISVDKNSAR